MSLPFAKTSSVEFNAFSCTSEKKMYNFTLFEGLQQSKMAIFKLSPILKKTKARWDILIMFSKITH